MVATDSHRLAMIESSGELPGISAAYRGLQVGPTKWPFDHGLTWSHVVVAGSV
jgi:hypothetical protein